MNNNQKKLVVILGPTACGKTRLAARLAARHRGEIISADSRQVYRGMDIGTGKDLVDYRVNQKKIAHHLIDVVSPKKIFNVAKYQQLAYRAINDVLRRGGQPFLVGGTGLYLDAVTFGYQFAAVNPNKLRLARARLDRLTLNQLLQQLKKVDAATYKVIDKKNRRRVQRALEIYYTTRRRKSSQKKNLSPTYEILFLGIKYPLEKIYTRIDKRLASRIKSGMINEVKKLRQGGVSWQRLESFGLEYRWVARYLRGQINHDELLVGLRQDIHHFAKRQLTWFKRNQKIIWIRNFRQAEQQVKKFLS